MLFQECQNKIGDKLGLHSLLTEPFQRFFKYQNLIESVLKKMQNNELNFMEIAATSKALHDVKKLLKTANKSMALTEIIDSKVDKVLFFPYMILIFIVLDQSYESGKFLDSK